MKNFLFALSLLFCIHIMAHSQTQKSIYLFSGSTNLSSFSHSTTTLMYDGEDTGESTTSTSYSISPSISYFFIDNLAIGFSLNYEYQKTEDTKDKAFLFGPMARYYFGRSKFRPFVHSDIGFGSSKSTYDDEEMSFNTTAVNLNGGIAVLANKYVSLDLSLGYYFINNSYNQDSDYDFLTSGVGINFGFSLYL